MNDAPAYNPGLHRVALLTAGATFPLIFMGGLVTSHGAGMSVPDWPNSYGYNMFLFPPRLWVGGVMYEHVHRLMGTVVGLLSISLVVWAWHTQIVNRATRLAAAVTRDRVHSRNLPPAYSRGVRWLCVAVLGAVIFQGVLGGLRVVMVELNLAIVHACFAQAFFCLAALTSVVTSRWWHDAPAAVPAADGTEASDGRQVARLALVAVGAIYLQLIAGALMRHYGAGLAIPDVPLAYGHALPPVSEAGLKLANETRTFDLRLPAVTMSQIWLHFAHRAGAVVVTGVVLLLAGRALGRLRGAVSWVTFAGAFAAALVSLTALGLAHAVGSTRGVLPGAAFFATAVLCGLVARAIFRRMGERRAVLGPAVLIAVLLVLQVSLGVLTVVNRKPADVTSAHVGVGALLLMTTFVLAIRARRLYPSRATSRVTGIARGLGNGTGQRAEPLGSELLTA